MGDGGKKAVVSGRREKCGSSSRAPSVDLDWHRERETFRDGDMDKRGQEQEEGG